MLTSLLPVLGATSHLHLSLLSSRVAIGRHPSRLVDSRSPPDRRRWCPRQWRLDLNNAWQVVNDGQQRNGYPFGERRQHSYAASPGPDIASSTLPITVGSLQSVSVAFQVIRPFGSQMARKEGTQGRWVARCRVSKGSRDGKRLVFMVVSKDTELRIKPCQYQIGLTSGP